MTIIFSLCPIIPSYYTICVSYTTILSLEKFPLHAKYRIKLATPIPFSTFQILIASLFYPYVWLVVTHYDHLVGYIIPIGYVYPIGIFILCLCLVVYWNDTPLISSFYWQQTLSFLMPMKFLSSRGDNVPIISRSKPLVNEQFAMENRHVQ